MTNLFKIPVAGSVCSLHCYQRKQLLPTMVFFYGQQRYCGEFMFGLNTTQGQPLVHYFCSCWSMFYDICKVTASIKYLLLRLFLGESS